MAVWKPTHVVTIGVYSPNERETVYYQCWVAAGPFDGAGDLGSALLGCLGASVDACEIIDRRVSTHPSSDPAWVQLGLFEEPQTFT